MSGFNGGQPERSPFAGYAAVFAGLLIASFGAVVEADAASPQVGDDVSLSLETAQTNMRLMGASLAFLWAAFVFGLYCTSGKTGRRLADAERKKVDELTVWRQDRLKQSQKMEAIGRMTSGVAHDFNNILTAILGNLELSINAVKQQYGEIPVLDRLRQAERSAERAADLTRQLLEYSRQCTTRFKPLDLNRILGEQGKMLQELSSQGIELSMELSDDLPQIHAEVSQIEQVIVNLAENARDAMPHGGKLTIATSAVALDEVFASDHPGAAVDVEVCLAVTDTGDGMDAKTIEKIYDPFFTTKTSPEGVGLGLFNVREIVKLTGGHVAVHSRPGQGTTFKVYLPAATETAPEDRQAKPSQAGRPRAAASP